MKVSEIKELIKGKKNSCEINLVKSVSDTCPECKGEGIPQLNSEYDCGNYYETFKCEECGCQYVVEFTPTSKTIVK